MAPTAIDEANDRPDSTGQSPIPVDDAMDAAVDDLDSDHDPPEDAAPPPARSVPSVAADTFSNDALCNGVLL